MSRSSMAAVFACVLPVSLPVRVFAEDTAQPPAAAEDPEAVCMDFLDSVTEIKGVQETDKMPLAIMIDYAVDSTWWCRGTEVHKAKRRSVEQFSK